MAPPSPRYPCRPNSLLDDETGKVIGIRVEWWHRTSVLNNAKSWSVSMRVSQHRRQAAYFTLTSETRHLFIGMTDIRLRSTRTNDYVMRKRKPSIKRSSILRPILRRENIKMNETYMRVEYMIQQDSSNSLLIEIKIDLAHRLRCEKIFVIDSDFPQSTPNLWQRLQKAAWIKEKNILHRRRFLELCFHAMNQDIIVFPADNFSYRRYSLRNVLNMKNTDELRLKLMKIPCDDLESRYVFRSLWRNDIIDTDSVYVLLNSTFRHSDEFEDKIRYYSD
jgi:hypothetical protein